MEIVDGYLHIEALVECPDDRCCYTVDLFEVERLTEEGSLHRAVLGNKGLGTDNLEEKVVCPACGCEFMVGAVRW